MTPWWKRADVWLFAVWAVSHVVRWSRGRLWALSSEPGAWWELLWAGVVLSFAVYMVVTGASVIAPSDRSATPAPFGAGARSVVLRAAILAVVGGLYAVGITWADRKPVAGPIALVLALAAVTALAGAIEVRARDAGALWRLGATLLVGLLAVPGALIAIAQAKYASAVQAGAAPEEAMHDTWRFGVVWAKRHLPLATGVALAHAAVVMARLWRSSGSLLGSAVALIILFFTSFLAVAGAWDGGVELAMTGGAALLSFVFVAGAAWGADVTERWLWPPSDEESRDGLEGPPR